MEGYCGARLFANSELVECPYDENHKVRRSRIQYHIVKCALKHPEVTLEVCPYNATHRVSRKALAAHMADCPYKGLELLSPITFQKPASNSPNLAICVGSENWDDEYPPIEQKSGASFIGKGGHMEKTHEKTCDSELISKQFNDHCNDGSNVIYPIESLCPEPTQEDESEKYCLRLPKTVPWYLKDTDLARRLGIK